MLGTKDFDFLRSIFFHPFSRHSSPISASAGGIFPERPCRSTRILTVPPTVARRRG